MPSRRIITIYSIVAGAIMTLFFVLQWINGRDGMADFRVYYDATRTLFSGETPYGKIFGVDSGYYKYSPAALIFFTPFAWLPYKVASSIFYFLIASTFIRVSMLLFKRISSLTQSPIGGWSMLIFGLLLSDMLIRELNLGNVNLIMLTLFLLAFESMRHMKFCFAGIMMAIGLLFKPHFIVLLPWLLIRRKWKAVRSMVVIFTAAMFAPALFVGWEGNMDLLSDWWGAMTMHNDAFASPNTFQGLIENFVFYPLGIEMNMITVLFVLLAAGAIYLAWMIRNGLGSPTLKVLTIEFYVLIALIPNLTHTDTEHFLLAAPLLLIISHGLFQPIKQKVLVILLVVLLAIPWAVNTPDLLGKDTAVFLETSGLLGLANILFILLAISVYNQCTVDSQELPS